MDAGLLVRLLYADMDRPTLTHPIPTMSFASQLRTLERAYLRPWIRSLRPSRDAGGPAAADLHGMQELGLAQRAAGGGNRPRLAFLSVLPPARTGLASYALAQFGDPRWGVDHFAPFAALDQMEPLLGQFRDQDRRFFHASELAALLASEDYRALLFQIGNSPHHVPLLRQMTGLEPGPPRWIYLHEGQLARFWLAWCQERPRALLELYRAHYPERRLNLNQILEGSPGDDAPRGIRPLLALSGCARIIVNSQFCVELVRKDLGPGWQGEILRLFHPIPAFPPPGPRAPGPLRIGHFGTIGHGKGVPLLVEALRLVRKERPAELLLAGYDAGRWARRHRIDRESWVQVLDAPPDGQLFDAMGRVDLAVQLRPVTQGESSGVVSQLLGLGRKVIASRTGAFMEFGDALDLVDADVSAAALAQKILHSAGQSPGEALARIQVEHSVQAFQDRLGRSLGLIDGPPAATEGGP